MNLDVVGVRQGLHEGIPGLLVFSDTVVQSGSQGAVTSLFLVTSLWMVYGHGYVHDANTGQRVLEVLYGELWDIFG